jgi:hypothetical protein
MGAWGGKTYAHEAGHILLSYEYGHDLHFGSIMSGTEDISRNSVLQQHIDGVLNNPQNIVNGASCGCP